MILNNEEKESIVNLLTWMIDDMKHRHDQLKGNLEEGSQGDYSPELKAGMFLLASIKKVETSDTTGFHRKAMLVNCREFACVLNRQGVCASVKVTLESTGGLLIGRLKCKEAERVEEDKEDDNGKN